MQREYEIRNKPVQVDTEDKQEYTLYKKTLLTKKLVANEKTLFDLLFGFGYWIALSGMFLWAIQGAVMTILIAIGWAGFWAGLLTASVGGIILVVILYLLALKSSHVKDAYSLVKAVDKEG